MNNKYDVKNFSDLIDKFKVEDEMQVITKEIEMRKGEVDRQFTIFDPLIERNDAKYDFASYKHRRYDLKNLNSDLLMDPPVRLRDHKNPKEVINYILDKAFVE